MREIHTDAVTEAVSAACVSANCDLPDDVEVSLRSGLAAEESSTGKDVLQQLIDNAHIAREESVPICQDTGFTVVFVDLGQEVHVVGDSLVDAINEGVRRGYRDGYLRKSIVAHPLDRANTGDNTPAVIHTEVVSGDGLTILIAPKGGGSENMSSLGMLKPSAGIEGVKKFVLDTVLAAGPNPCPPIIVGVGIGGTMEKAALLAKKAVLRKVGVSNEDPRNATLERDLLALVNRTGIGPGGMGGRVTALAVNVESYPAHIASLPVAVNIQCHAARHLEVRL